MSKVYDTIAKMGIRKFKPQASKQFNFEGCNSLMLTNIQTAAFGHFSNYTGNFG